MKFGNKNKKNDIYNANKNQQKNIYIDQNTNTKC